MLTQFLIGLAIHEFVAELVGVSDADYAAAKARALAKIQAWANGRWFSTSLGHLVLKALDALEALLKDQPDLETGLKDLAQKDWAGAEAALLADLVKAVPELAGVLGAAPAA